MKAIYFTILAIVILTASCADPAANKPKAQVAEPISNSTPTPASTSKNPFSLMETDGTALAITPENSKIEFTGSKVTGKHDGGFKMFKGVIDLVDNKAEKSKVLFEIDMASVFTDADGLTKHLQTHDFFDVAKFPSAVFASTKIAPDASGKFSVTGDLELHGVKKSITFPADIAISPQDVKVKAEFAINRKDFGISYAGKADDLIRDDVVIKLDVTGQKK